MHRLAWPLLVSALGCAGLSCATDPGPPSPVGIAVQWGLGEPSALPSDVDTVVVYICYADEEECDRNQCSLAALTGEGESDACRPAEGTDAFGDRPVLVRRELRTGVPVSFTLVGRAGSAYQYIGQAGPLVLGEGSRRQVDIFMYPVGSASSLDADLPRLLPTTSMLPDGRVLIAGGFDSATEGECPMELGLPMGTRCYDLVATDRAVAFDPASRRVTPLRDRLLEARGGHTATELPDGRVLIAGGAPRAIAAFSPIGAVDSGRFEVQLFPQTEDGEAGAHASFELFDAYLDGEDADPEGDGDPARGRFLGTSGTASPGALNAPRFMHAAATVPSAPAQVVLVGGLGGGAQSYEVFDAEKAGGFGVYRGGGALAVPRPMPGAVGLGDDVWIFGGAYARDNAGLAEVWSAGADPNGSVAVASDATEFPAASAGMVVEEPRYGLVRPTVAAVDGGNRALAVGWYGTQCEVGMTTPVFFEDGVTELCNSPGAGGARTSFTVSRSGVTTGTGARPRAFGAAARLWSRPNETNVQDNPFVSQRTGEVAFVGGIANIAFSGQASIELFTGRVSSTGEAITDSSRAVSLSEQRFFHASVGVPGGAIVTAGGASFDTLRGLSLATSVEVVIPPG